MFFYASVGHGRSAFCAPSGAHCRAKSRPRGVRGRALQVRLLQVHVLRDGPPGVRARPGGDAAAGRARGDDAAAPPIQDGRGNDYAFPSARKVWEFYRQWHRDKNDRMNR